MNHNLELNKRNYQQNHLSFVTYTAFLYISNKNPDWAQTIDKSTTNGMPFALAKTSDHTINYTFLILVGFLSYYFQFWIPSSSSYTRKSSTYSRLNSKQRVLPWRHEVRILCLCLIKVHNANEQCSHYFPEVFLFCCLLSRFLTCLNEAYPSSSNCQITSPNPSGKYNAV